MFNWHPFEFTLYMYLFAMKNILKNSSLILLFSTCFLSLKAQNLVLNPSFENTISCPMGISELPKANNWDDLNTNVGGDSCSSPDLYAGCSWTIGGANSPAALLGYQNSRTGTHHAGMIVESRPPIISSCPPASGSVDNYREYIGGELSTPLVAGQSYCVQMYVNMATKSGWGISKLGFYFYNSATPIAKDFCASPTPIQIPLTDPKLLVTTGAPIVDTVNWVLLNWNYIAQGGENRFAIGNFFDKSTQVRAGNDCASNNLIGGTYSYYFVDDISVTPGSCCITSVTIPTNICVSNAPFNLVPQTPGGTFSGTGITNASNGTFSPAIAGSGTFTITYTLPCGSENFQITVANCASLAVCQETNGNLTVSGGTSPYTWQTQTTSQNCSACLVGCNFPPNCAVTVTNWTTYSNNATAAPGALPIRVQDNAGNSQVITSLVSIPQCSVSTPCPTITLSTSGVQNVTCNGDNNGTATVVANGGTIPYTYSWMPGNLNGATQTSLAPNTYTITATDNVGCTGTTTVTITEYPVLSATTTSTASGCTSNTGSASVNPTGGLAPYQFVWSPTGGTNASATGLSAGTYTVTVTDAAGCSITESIIVSSSSGLTISSSGIQAVSCNGYNDGTATVSASGGTGPYTYVWQPGNLNGGTQAALSASTYTVTATDNSGCTGTISVVIAENPVLVGVTSSTPSDCSINNGTATISVSGGLAPYQYIWSPSGGTNASATGLSAGNYAVSVTDAAGCQITENVVVSSNGGPTLSVSTLQQVSCFGLSDGSAAVTITGGSAPFTTTWNPSGETGLTATQLAAGVNTVTVVDNGGCQISSSFTISEPAALQISGTVTDEDCGLQNGSITTNTIGGTGTYIYSWTGSVSTSANLSGIASGDYTVTVLDDFGCSATASYTVNQIGSLPVTVTPSSVLINEGDTVQLSASGGDTYLWEPSESLSCSTCPNPIASPSSSIVYQVTVTNASGCSGIGTVSISVIPNCGEIFVPSIFSPNGDNNNDVLCAMGNCFAEVTFSIFNRWGEKVFETDDLSVCWDANFKNKPVNTDVFVYKLIGKLLNGTAVDVSGNIQVVR